MVEKKVSILFDFITQGGDDAVKQVEAINKKIAKLSAPKSITEAIEKTKFSNLNAQLKSLGTTSKGFEEHFKKAAQITLKGWDKESIALNNIKLKRQDTLETLAGKTGIPLEQVTQMFKGLNYNSLKWKQIVRELGLKTRMFKMELLGVMFFGMGVQRFFTGLLKPSMDLVGVFDSWTTLLSVVFLPVGIKLLRWVMKLWELFGNLSPETKALINNFVLLGAGIGTLSFLFGMLGLGLKSLSIAFSGWSGLFGGLFTAFSSFGTFLSGLGISIGAFLAIALIGIIGFVLAWKENFMNIHEFVRMIFDGIKQIFEGFVQVVKGIMGMVWSLFTADPKKFWDYFKQLVEGIGNILGGLVNLVTGIVGTITASFSRAIKGLFDFGWKIGDYLAQALNNLIDKAGEWGSKFIKYFIRGMLAVVSLGMSGVAIAIMDYFPSSPAKTGALKNIEKSGAEFMRLFFEGANYGIDEYGSETAQKIMDLISQRGTPEAVMEISDIYGIQQYTEEIAELINTQGDLTEDSELYRQFLERMRPLETDSTNLINARGEAVSLLSSLVGYNMINAMGDYINKTSSEIKSSTSLINTNNNLADSYLRIASAKDGDKYDKWVGGGLTPYGQIPAKDVMQNGQVVHIPAQKRTAPKDFILTNSGQMIQPDKGDTIMGMKSGGAIGDIISNAVASAVGSLFGRIDINITAPSGYEATARMSGGRV